MIEELEDARKLAHGTYEDVIVVEYRKAPGAVSGSGFTMGSKADVEPRHVVLEMPEGSRAIDKAQQYEIDGVVGDAAPIVGASYRLIIGPPATQPGRSDGASGGSLRYETMNR